MGNRSLRKQASEALKSGGYPFKLYRGKGFKHAHNAYQLRKIIQYAKLRVGDVVHDCDGFNHVVANQSAECKFPVLFYRDCAWEQRRKGYCVLMDTQLKWDDLQDVLGQLSCGCGALGEPAHRGFVENYFLSFWEYYKDTWAKEPWQVEAAAFLKSGGHICDERGVLLPEWVAKKAVRSVDTQQQIL